jgi:hypothetical protein
MKTDSAVTGAAVGAGCLLLLILVPICWCISALLIMLGWNLGLEGAGIVENDIGFGVAFGLAVALSLVGSVFRSIVTITKS